MLNKSLFALQTLGFLVLLVAFFLLNHHSPLQQPLIGLLPFTVPFLLLFQLPFILWWLLRRRWTLLAASFAFAACIWPFWQATWQPPHLSSPPQKALKVLSYNVRVFCVYDYLNNQQEESEATISFVEQDDSDIKCLQEFYDEADRNRPSIYYTTKRFRASGTPYTYVQPFEINHVGDVFGLAIFSRYPIVNQGIIDIHGEKNMHGKSNGAIFADIDVQGDTLRVVNIHLQSLALEAQQLLFDEQAHPKDRLRLLLRNFLKSERVHALQSDRLMEALAQSPYPLLVCGDFNALPYSYTYQQLRQRMDNTFEQAGSGLGITLNKSFAPCRIDNIFCSKQLQTLHAEHYPSVQSSDHFPLKAWVEIPVRKTKPLSDI